MSTQGSIFWKILPWGEITAGVIFGEKYGNGKRKRGKR
jgi:hypothetical protein